MLKKDKKGREGKGREGKGREGKGREGKGREGKGREGKGREGKGREGKLYICISTNLVGSPIFCSIQEFFICFLSSLKN